MYLVKMGKGHCVVNRHGKQLLPIGDYSVGDPRDGKMIVQEKGQTIVLHQNGQRYVVSQSAQTTGPTTFFSEGLAVQKKRQSGFGYIDPEAQWYIKAQFVYAYPFKWGLALAVTNKGVLAAIDKRGVTITTFKHLTLREQECLCSPRDPLAFIAHVKRNGSWNWALVTGLSHVKVLRQVRGDIRDVKEGVFGAEVSEGRWRLFSADGDALSDPIYSYMYEANDGLVTVQSQAGKWGTLDIFGQTIIPCEFAGLGEFRSGFARAEVGNTTMLVDRKGNPVMTSTKSDFEVYEDGVVCQGEAGTMILNWGGEPLWRWPFTLRRSQLGLKFSTDRTHFKRL